MPSHRAPRRVSLRKKGGKHPSHKAIKSRKTARGHQQSVAAKIFPPLDVHSKKDIADALKRIMKGPVTILLVYADWCGHCHEIMPHWDKAVQSPQRSVQSIKLNEKNTESFNAALRNVNQNESSIHVSGYPTVLVLDQKGNAVTEVQAKKDTASLTQLMNRSGPLAEQAGLSHANEGHVEPQEQEQEPEQEQEQEQEPEPEEGLAAQGDPRNIAASLEPTSLPLVSPPRLTSSPSVGGAHPSRKARRGGLYRMLHPRTRKQ